MQVFFIKLYILTLAVFFGIDLVWLGLVAKNFYAKHLGYIMSTSPNWTAALIFYLLHIVGMLVFAVLPGYKSDSVMKTILLGALYGLCTYATYDLTNLATLKQWPIIVTIVDLMWGVLLSSIVSTAGYYIARAVH